MNEYRVKLTYFKSTGKMYSEGNYITNKEWMYEISDEVREMKRKGYLPEICGKEWIVHIEVEESHPNGYPCLIL